MYAAVIVPATPRVEIAMVVWRWCQADRGAAKAFIPRTLWPPSDAPRAVVSAPIITSSIIAMFCAQAANVAVWVRM